MTHTDDELADWEHDGDLTGWIEAGKYEQQLQAAAQRLQAVLPIGKAKAIGVMEVVEAVDELIAENSRLKTSLRAARKRLRDIENDSFGIVTYE